MPRRRNPYRLIRLGLLLALGIILIAYVVGLAALQSRASSWLRFDDLIVPRALDAVIIVWLLFVGASIGSFLNVVAWRLPQGKTVLGRSYCPRCMTQLRARDNFPVFGWLAVGGRCRTCRLPISPRYPIVEAAVALSLAPVGFAELYRRSLPYQDVPTLQSPLMAPLVDVPLIATLLYHLVALSLAWAYGLIRYDGHSLPKRLAIWGFAALLLPMLIEPAVMGVPWQTAVDDSWRGGGRYLDAVVRLLTGLAAASFFARALARGLCPTADPKLDPLGRGTSRLLDLITVLSVPAVVIGWQSLPAVLLLAGLSAILLGRIPSLRTDTLGRFALSMPVALAFQLVFWRNLHQAAWWPSPGSDPLVVLIASALVLALPILLRDSATHVHSPEYPDATTIK